METTMLDIKIVLYLRNYEKDGLQQIRSIFQNTFFPFNISGYEVSFSTYIKWKRIIASNRESNAKDIQICFIGKLSAEIDMDRNIICYYDNFKSCTQNEISLQETKHFYEYDYLDEGFDAQLEVFCLSMVYSIILTAPDINLNTAHFKIYLNQRLFKDRKYIEYPIYEDAYKEWTSIFKTKLGVRQTWDWLTKYGVKYKSKPLCPYVQLLYYLFNREYFEIVLFSVIGLEALFLDKKNKTGKSYTLQNRIHTVFPEISKDQIKKMYNIRSNITHGEGDMASSIVWLDLINNDMENEQMAVFSSALFLESIRRLISHNAIGFTFEERMNITYGFE